MLPNRPARGSASERWPAVAFPGRMKTLAERGFHAASEFTGDTWQLCRCQNVTIPGTGLFKNDHPWKINSSGGPLWLGGMADGRDANVTLAIREI